MNIIQNPSDYSYRLSKISFADYYNIKALSHLQYGILGHTPKGAILLRTASTRFEPQNFAENFAELEHEFRKANLPIEKTEVRGYAQDGLYVGFKGSITAKTLEVGKEKFNLNYSLSMDYVGKGSIVLQGYQKQGKDAVWHEVERLVCTNGLKIKIRTLVEPEEITRAKEVQTKMRQTKKSKGKFDVAIQQVGYMLANEVNVRNHIQRVMDTEVALPKEDLVKILMHNTGINFHDGRKGGVSERFELAMATYLNEEKELGYASGSKSSSLWLGANAVNHLYGSANPEMDKSTITQINKFEESLWGFVDEATNPEKAYTKQKWEFLKQTVNKLN